MAFSFGLATTLAVLGIASSLLGRTYGQFGDGLPIAVGLVAVIMGLNLLELLPIALPSLDVDVRRLSAPPLVQVPLTCLEFYRLNCGWMMKLSTSPYVPFTPSGTKGQMR